MKTEDPKGLSPVERAQQPLADWQLERIDAGVADVRAGRVRPADEVFAGIAAKHGWAEPSNRPL